MINKILNFLLTSNMYIYLIFNEILVLITLILLALTLYSDIFFLKIKEAWYIIVYLLLNFYCIISKIDYMYLIFKYSKRKKIIKRNYKKFFLLNCINLIFMCLNVYSLSYFFIIPHIINLLCLIFLKYEENKYPGQEKRKRKRRNNDIELRRYQM